MERTTVPGGCTSVRQTIGDILSTANVVTAAATDEEPSQDTRRGMAAHRHRRAQMR